MCFPLFITCFNVHFPNFNSFGFGFELCCSVAISVSMYLPDMWICSSVFVCVCLCVCWFLVPLNWLMFDALNHNDMQQTATLLLLLYLTHSILSFCLSLSSSTCQLSLRICVAYFLECRWLASKGILKLFTRCARAICVWVYFWRVQRWKQLNSSTTDQQRT